LREKEAFCCFLVKWRGEHWVRWIIGEMLEWKVVRF
jgi:hypothetical protein